MAKPIDRADDLLAYIDEHYAHRDDVLAWWATVLQCCWDCALATVPHEHVRPFFTELQKRVTQIPLPAPSQRHTSKPQ